MKLLTCSIALLFSLCSFGQSKLLQDLDTNINHPVWVAHFLNKKEQARIALPKDYAEPFLSDTVLIAVPQGKGTMDMPVPTRKEDDQVIRQDNQKLQEQPVSCDLVAFSSNTGRVLWYVSELPKKFAISICKNNVICSQPGGIQCFDLLTGKTNWWHPTKDKVVYSSPDLPFFVYPVDSLLYVLYTPAYYSVDTAHSFFIISAKTGKVLKTFTHKALKDITKIEYACKNSVILGYSEGLECIDINSGQKIWDRKTHKEGLNVSQKATVEEYFSSLKFFGDTLLYREGTYTSMIGEGPLMPDSLGLLKISTGERINCVAVSSAAVTAPGEYYHKYVQRYTPDPWFGDGDTAYFYSEGSNSYPTRGNPRYLNITRTITKYNIRTLKKLWEETIPALNDSYRNVIFTDEKHFYYTSGDTLHFGNKIVPNKSIKKLNYSFRVTDVSQSNSLLFLSYNGYPNIEYDDLKHLTDFSVLDKSNLQYTPLQRDNMYLLLPDYKNGFLYLIDRQKGLVKVQLPK